MTISAVSPGVTFSEIDLTGGVPAVSTTTAAHVGVFRWGPVDDRVLVSSEKDLAARFGTPTNFNAETFFTAADFLSYSNSLFLTRVASADAFNAGANSQIITQEDAELHTGADIIARYPGALGNSLKISICPSSTAFEGTDISGFAIDLGSNTATVVDPGTLQVDDVIRVGNTAIGYQDMVVTEINGTDIDFASRFRLAGNTGLDVTRYWGGVHTVGGAPDADSIHVVVYDEDGEFTGQPGSVLEIYENVSVLPGAKLDDGSSNYYKDVINNRSAFVYTTADDISAAGQAEYIALTNGTDGDDEANVSIGELAAGYDLYKSTEEIDISLILQGRARTTTLANYIIDNIAEFRKDCVAFISPTRETVVNNRGSEVPDLLTFRNGLTASSYAFLDSGYKYRYDKYNDVYRYTPLNGDIAGLTARTDMDREPWFSPSGYNRGIIKNVVNLPFNPNKAQRDQLYGKDINPVITESGRGTLLFGDKTLLGKQSAFNRINVRRLFIVIEKAVTRAAKDTLWELNDEFTRASFTNIVEPFLREIQGRRGIYDFRVVADETVNTPQVIDSNEFVANIYIKPARSINFIHINFIGVRTGIEFEEVVGRAV